MSRAKPQPPPDLLRMNEALISKVNNLQLEMEQRLDERMEEGYAGLDWANRIDRDYLWIRTSGANAPQFRYMTKATIDMYSDQSHFMRVFNPLIKRIVTVKTQFTFALDFSITSQSLQTNIDAIKKNRLNRQAVFTHKAITDIDGELLESGNVYLAIWKDMDPVRIRGWPNNEITDIITDGEDTSRPLFYIRKWQGDNGKENKMAYPSIFAFPKDIPNSKTEIKYLGESYKVDATIHVYHISTKKPLRAKFALTELVAACRWAKPHERFLEDFAAIVSAYRKYTHMMTTKGGAGQAAAIKAQMQGNTEYMGTPLQSNPPGSMIVAPEGNELKVIDAGSGKLVGPEHSRYYLIMVSAASDVPETYLTMDPSTGNLATAKEISPVFINMIQERQTLWKETFIDVFEFILDSTDFEVSFPPIRDNLQAYVDAINKFAKDNTGQWTGALDAKDYVAAAYESLEWKAPDEEKLTLLAANIEGAAGESATPPGTDQALTQLAQAAQGLMEAAKKKA